MRYITATIGAMFIFVAVVVISFVVNSFLPPTLQRTITIPHGVVTIWGTPALFVGIAIGVVAAVHSFRSTLKRRTNKEEKSSVD